MSGENHIIHIIAGPTASGKSGRALDLAEELDGVIINCDSMQIYDALPILTAQPAAGDQEKAPHRLYAELHPNETCSAGTWREMAEPVIEEILQKGQAPIITGGSGLYIKALTEGLSPIPDIPDDIRAAAVKKQQQLGNPAFHEELKKRDPVMAERFHPYHTARLVRAWEVLEATGKGLAEWQKEPLLGPPAHWQFEIHKIMPERETLRTRCDQRFLWMMENGAVEETEVFSQQLDSGEIKNDAPVTKALGFRHIRAYIKGELSKDEAIERAQADTRQYAKRQTTWFRHQL